MCKRLIWAVLVLSLGCCTQAQYPAILDCTSLMPQQCVKTPILNGTFSFSTYQEECTGLVCVTPAPAADWLCRGDVLNYPTAVTAEPVLPPGKAEDDWAACLYNNWDFVLLQDNCRDIQLWSCDDCRAAYRSWLCAQAFPRCSNGDPVQRVPACRDNCFNVVQKCPVTTGFTCPLTDPRDYRDGSSLPACNNVVSTVVR